MEEIARLYAGTIDTTNIQVVNSASCVVVKTLMLGNNTDKEQTATMIIDGATFNFKVTNLNTLVLDHPIVCNTIQMSATDTLSLQISGIKL